MRALFLLLLLANLLFFAWTRWVAPAPAVAGHATPAAADPRAIRLLREAPLGQQSASASAGVATAAELVCVSAGPYVDRAQAGRAAARLGRLGFESRLRGARDEVRVGQWVRLENLATPEDAANAVAVLRAAGIADAYAFEEAGAGTVVSLGVFSDTVRADQVIAVARTAGFDPRVVERSRPADVVWLDVDRRANAGLPSLEDLRGDGPDDTRLELRPCPQSAN